jgi:hypothetical protein
MAQKTRSRKRPCRVCGKWFSPDPRLGDRQKTCGAAECQRQRHAAKCAEWNRKNRSCFRESYLKSRIDSAKRTAAEHPPSPCSPSPEKPGSRNPSPLDLPRKAVEEVMGAQQLVIIEYIVRLLLRGVQETISTQHVEIAKEFRQQLALSRSRDDGQGAAEGVCSLY